jgi:hypothetical protein
MLDDGLQGYGNARKKTLAAAHLLQGQRPHDFLASQPDRQMA